MSLKGFEQAWLELLLNPARREAWLAGEASFQHLSPQERAGLQARAPEVLAARVSEVRRERQRILEAALPPRIHQLLGPEHFRAVLDNLLGQASLPPLYPRLQLLSEVLNHSLGYLGRQHLIIPHLRDLISYELAAAHLDFFCLPKPLAATPGPRLASWARLIRLGSQFPLLLESLNRGYAAPDLSETPKQRFLLTREFRGLRLEVLPPLVAACLEACDGQTPWEVLAQAALQQQEPDAGGELAALQTWYGHFLQRGVLVESTAAAGLSS